MSENNNNEDRRNRGRQQQQPEQEQQPPSRIPIIVIVPQNRNADVQQQLTQQQQQQQQQFISFRQTWNGPRQGNYDLVPVGKDSTRIICPNCHQTINTVVVVEPKNQKCFFITLLLSIPFCCLVWPCMMACLLSDCCQRINHYCPNCTAYVGYYKHR